MSHKESYKVKIQCQSGDKVNNVLKDCYFYPHPSNDGTYEFFLENFDTPLATGLKNGSAFTFPLGTFSWVIPNPSDPENTLKFKGKDTKATATGSYLNNDTRRVSIRVQRPSPGDDVSGESGTFQAQTGQTLDPEKEAASSAKA